MWRNSYDLIMEAQKISAGRKFTAAKSKTPENCKRDGNSCALNGVFDIFFKLIREWN